MENLDLHSGASTVCEQAKRAALSDTIPGYESCSSCYKVDLALTNLPSGHTNAFLKDPEGLLRYGRLYFRNSREPFALTVAGQTLYVVLLPQDVKEVRENVGTLSPCDLTRELITGMGLTPAVRERIIRGLSHPCDELDTALLMGNVKKPLIRYAQGFHKPIMKYAESLQALPDEIIQHIKDSMRWDMLSAKYTKPIISGEKEVSLLSWCRETMVNAATRAYFGEGLLQIEPNLSQVLSDFEDEGVMFLISASCDSIGPTSAARERGIGVFAAYFGLPMEQRAGEAGFIRNLEDEYRHLGLGEKDLAALIWVVYWVINANTYKLAFWLLSHFLQNPALLAGIRGELALSTLPRPRPLLTACLNEALRTTSAPCTLHRILAPTTIGSKLLLPSAKILIPYKQIGLSEDVFGPNPLAFEPERFLLHPELAREAFFAGEAGGMVLHKEAVLAFVELALGRFEVTRCESVVGPLMTGPRRDYEYKQAKGEWPDDNDDDEEMGIKNEEVNFPRLAEMRGNLGVAGPVQGDDLLLRLRKR